MPVRTPASRAIRISGMPGRQDHGELTATMNT